MYGLDENSHNFMKNEMSCRKQSRIVQKLDRLKKQASRRIVYCINPEDRQDTDVLMVKYNIKDLRLRRKRNLVKIIYMQSKNSENLKATSVERALRSANKLKMKNYFTNIIKVHNSPIYRGISLWDSLPASLQKKRTNAHSKRKYSRTLSSEII